MKGVACFLVILALGRGLLLAEGPVWEPARTWVFAVGVIRFDNPKTTGWPEAGRADAKMMEVLEKRGVPPEQILFLKNEEATRANIAEKFGPFVQRAGTDDTLLFYYAGHGGRDYSQASRPCTFLTYDTGSKWEVGSIFDTVEKNFRGRQVIYTADCCHSGCLVVEAARHPGRVAALTSAHVASTSTGNWTFTRSLIQIFEGDPMLDESGDGRITFAEASGYVVNEMAFLEGQHSASGTNGGFPADTVMALVTGRRTPRMGEMIEAESEGIWWRAKVLAEREGEVRVTWPGWGKQYDEWLPLERTRAYKPKTFPVGAQVEVEWRKRWWDARIVKVKLGLQLVHYEGYPDGDDEWVRTERVRERGK